MWSGGGLMVPPFPLVLLWLLMALFSLVQSVVVLVLFSTVALTTSILMETTLLCVNNGEYWIWEEIVTFSEFTEYNCTVHACVFMQHAALFILHVQLLAPHCSLRLTPMEGSHNYDSDTNVATYGCATGYTVTISSGDQQRTCTGKFSRLTVLNHAVRTVTQCVSYNVPLTVVTLMLLL